MTEKKYVPTEPGLVWWRENGDDLWQPILVTRDCLKFRLGGCVMMGTEREPYVKELAERGTFHPRPIQPPEEGE